MYIYKLPFEPQQRYRHIPRSGEHGLGPLSNLPGKWTNEPGLEGRGWNMIALPFGTPDNQLKYRLLLNQYNEELDFFLVDKGVPNRGIREADGVVSELDQRLVTLDYEQEIRQFKVADFPATDEAHRGGENTPIHHEPGLWLHMLNESEGLDIARLASVPHGDSVLALGQSRTFVGPPQIPDVSGLPIGVGMDIDNDPYLEPYRRFRTPNAFERLFDPTIPAELLKSANADVTIKQTTELKVDTRLGTGGIKNIPFIVNQANAVEMESTFWIEELAETDAYGWPRLRLQYLQIVMLEFFPRHDGVAGLIKWPHVSINTLEWRQESLG
jgi:hypothetical protein